MKLSTTKDATEAIIKTHKRITSFFRLLKRPPESPALSTNPNEKDLATMAGTSLTPP